MDTNPPPAREEGRLDGFVAPQTKGKLVRVAGHGCHIHQATRGSWRVEACQADQFLCRDVETGIGHPQRLEDALPEEFIQGQPAHQFHQPPKHIRANAVCERLAGLVVERDLDQALDLVSHAFIGAQHRSLLEQGIDRGACIQPIPQPGGVREQVVDGHRALQGSQFHPFRALFDQHF